VPEGRVAEIGAALMARLDALACFTDEPGRLTRFYLTQAHRVAADQVRAWMEEAGLTSEIDAIGNVVGRTELAPERPLLILGSHIDTVRDAGRYDGALGVLGAIAAIEELRRRGAVVPFDIEVIAFGDEEGARFPSTLSGSRAVAGSFDLATLDVVDAEDVSLRQALVGFGCDPAGIPALSRRGRRVVGYLELHIEQGPVLEAEGLPVGVVTAIAGAVRLTATLRGVAGHAGTVPMAMRRDALAAAAELVLAVEEAAQVNGGGLVATVGQLALRPGASNSIPGEVVLSIDLRAERDDVRDATLQRIETAARAIAATRHVTIELRRTYEAPAVQCDAGLQAILATVIGGCGLPVCHLQSGAGHDALVMGPLGRIGMLFTRCRGGVSHTPAESITAEDAGLSVMVLCSAIEQLAGDQSFWANAGRPPGLDAPHNFEGG
jgi:allantoate deiminase